MPPQQRRRLDLASILGLAAALLIIAAALVLGGAPGAFFNIPSLLIVLGGTAAVTLVSFSLADLGTATRQALRALVRPVQDAGSNARYVLDLADYARRFGPLALQPMLPSLRAHPMAQRSLELIVDGLPADDVERILRTEIEAGVARARAGSAVLRRAAEVAPAMGLIGTLVGLVQMLGNLSDPSSIGPAMAVALLTTFYGAVLGSMVLSPLAGKVDRNADAQALADGIWLLAAGSVARQENPRRLEILINTLLPPDRRLNAYD
jgi:chemotaxis protein MotA